MTMLTGRPNNYVRIPESQYQADIAAAEERGRADAATKPASAASSLSDRVAPTQEQEAAMAEVKLLQKAAAAGNSEQDPNAMAAQITAHVAAAAREGRKISVAQAAAELFKK